MGLHNARTMQFEMDVKTVSARPQDNTSSETCIPEADDLRLGPESLGHDLRLGPSNVGSSAECFCWECHEQLKSAALEQQI